MIQRPYRKPAKAAYLKMLEEHTSVESVAEACVEFGWADAIPRLQGIVDHPDNLREYEYALHAKRTLEERPIAQELLDAETTLRQGAREEDVGAQRTLAAARRTLIGSDDAEAANLAALSLALYVNKSDVSDVRAMGLEILKLRPRDETVAFLRSLAQRIDTSERDAIEKVALDVAR